MMMIEVTNILLKRLYQADLKIDLDLSLDDTVMNAVQIQIDIKPKYFKDFSIFYGSKDYTINFSSIFEVKDKNYIKIKELFEKDKGIFDCCIVDDIDEIVHLYGTIEIAEIVTYADFREIIDDSFITNIINYLSEEHELTNYWNSINK